MSNISIVIDTLVDKCEEMFPSHSRIPIPESLENNAIPFLRQGWGIKYNGAERIDGEFHTYVFNHNFSVVFTRELIRLDSDTEEIDTSLKDILEDVYTLQNRFYQNDEVGIPDNMRNLDLSSVSSVGDVKAGNNNFKTVEVNFVVVISEII